MTFTDWVSLIVGLVLTGEAIFLAYFLWRNYREN